MSAAPRPAAAAILPLATFCGWPCGDCQRSRALTVQHTRDGMARDDPFVFASTDSCEGGFQRIHLSHGEKGPLRELFFSAGTPVAAHE